MDFMINNTVIPDHVVDEWQQFVDTIAKALSVPSVMINRLDPPELEVFCSNMASANPFPSGTRMPLAGVFCESTARRRRHVEVTDARTDCEWSESPTAKAGIYAYSGYPLLWPDGNVFGTLCVVDTQENQWGPQADQLLCVFREAIESHLALAYANECVKAASQAKSEFLANMSHEIRTPMTAILGFSDVLMEGDLREDQIEAVKIIKRNGEYLLELINDILDLSKIESGKLQVEHINCTLCQVLSEVVSLMRIRAYAKGLSLEIQYDSLMPRTIQTDPIRLRQILINLVGNAVKFTEYGGISLHVRLIDEEPDQAKLRFDVADTGIGMTERQMANLFKPFSQADKSTTRKHGGTGLGLAICKRLTEQLGGGITVTSTPGQGSVFSATIQIGSIVNVEMVRCPMESKCPTNEVSPFKVPLPNLDCRILLAEDGPDNQRLIAFFMKKAGARLDVVDNGLAAYDLALAARDQGEPFDVILMDMQMPVMDGFIATAKLREAGYAGTIIALTAYAMQSDRERCIKAGCDDFISKPVDRERLIAIIAAHLPFSTRGALGCEGAKRP